MKKIFKEIKEAILNANKIAIFGHKSSDADCIGSLLSLYYVLNSLGKNVDAFVEDIPANLKLLDEDNILSTDKVSDKYDLYITVDSATLKQLGKYKEVISNQENTIMIDHHAIGEPYAKFLLVEGTMPSTCDLLVSFYKFLKIKFNKKISNTLFAGIMGDTGRLMFSGNNLLPYNNAIFLIKNGADAKFVNDVLFRNISKQTFSLKKTMLQNTELKNKYAICVVSNDELPNNNYTTGDYVNEMLSIQSVVISVLCIEKKSGIFNISIRTKGEYNASEIAQEVGGGGHYNASGASIISDDKNYVKNKMIALIKKQLKG